MTDNLETGLSKGLEERRCPWRSESSSTRQESQKASEELCRISNLTSESLKKTPLAENVDS